MTPTSEVAPVTDASALMVVVFDEPGRESAAARLPGSFLSTVNLSETLQKTVQKGRSVEDLDRIVGLLGISVIPFSADQARAAAELWPSTAHRGLSFGDRACIALGLELGRPILTADRAWMDLRLPVTLELIPR